MKRKPWSDKAVSILRAEYPDTPTATLAKRLKRSVGQVYQKANSMGLRKSEAYLASPAACRLRRGDNVGAAHRFKKGQTSWNAGAHYQPGGRAAETQFKPGAKPQTWVPVGTEVVDTEGYRKRKVRDDAPAGMARKNWKFVHVILWEERYGPIPPGHIVVFKDRNRSNITIENLELITRVENMTRNTVHRLPKELALAVQLKGALVRQINKRMPK